MQQISFLINTSVNTLDHVKLLLHSLKENLSGKEHEILIFIDSDNEGTKEYLIEQKKNFHDLKIITHSLPKCVGYSRNNNLLVELAKHDIVSYLQSDMVISKDYDVHILEQLEDNCILSSTRIEPPLHGYSQTVITHDFGVYPETFRFDEFVKFAELQRSDKTLQYFFAPFTFYKKVWMDVGGYDTIFRRSREDSDLLQRFIQRGVKIKQTFGANVYHFSCVTSRGKNWFEANNKSAHDNVELQKIADSIELRRFFRKWGAFTHGEYVLKKLDMDLVLHGDTTKYKNIVSYVEPFFTRVWVDSDIDKNNCLTLYGNEHDPANKLLSFSDSDWEYSKKFYNLTDYNAIFNVGMPETFNIKVEMWLDTITQVDEMLNNVHRITDMFEDAESGIYEIGNSSTKVHIDKIVYTSDGNLVVKNPPFDNSLLQIL
jgi:GT2 family glycosyltransferase